MKFRFLALAALPCVLLLAACGDGPDDASTPTPRATAGNTGDFGPAPALGGNILKVTPEHASTVTQASTVTRDPRFPKGVCVDVSFEGLPAYGQAFRFIVDEADVTAGGDTSWIVATTNNPTNGTLCFAPAGGLKVGRHTAAVGVQDPNNLTAPFKQVVAWAFQVTE